MLIILIYTCLQVPFSVWAAATCVRSTALAFTDDPRRDLVAGTRGSSDSDLLLPQWRCDGRYLVSVWIDSVSLFWLTENQSATAP